MSTPDPRTEAAAKSLPYVNNYYPTNGQMAIDGGHVGVNDVPMDNQTPFVLRSDYDLLTDALTTEAVQHVGKWSTARPTVAGWYWWRGSAEASPQIYEIDIMNGEAFYRVEGSQLRDTWARAMCGEWCPIERPD